MHDRICPTCSLTLRNQRAGEVDIDVCPDCHGVWLDAGEFDQIVARKYAGRDIEADIDNLKFVRLDAPPCPKGHPQMLGINFNGVEIDHCRECRGFWVGAAARDALSTLPTVEYTPGPKAPTDVTCSACGAEVDRKQAVLHNDTFWCNTCVLRGNYPGAGVNSAYKTLSHMKISAAHRDQNIAERTQNLRRIHSPFESFFWEFINILHEIRKSSW